MVLQKIIKKFKHLGPVLVEGKFNKRLGHTFQEFFTWLDRKYGYAARCVMTRHTDVIPNQIMFFPFQNDIACNLKYISEELIRRQADVQIYWAVATGSAKIVELNPLTKIDAKEILAKEYGELDHNDPKVKELKQYIKTHVHCVRTSSYEYFKAAMSSKILITNSILGEKFYPFPVKKNQIVCETWHGSLGIKRFDPAHYNTNMSWPIAAKRTGKLTNYCFTNSTFEDAVFRETFWQKTPFLQYGHARNDIFFPQFEKTREYLRNTFLEENGLDQDVKLALYAPTFRDDHNFEVYDLDAYKTVKALEEKFGGKWYLMLRYHDNDKKNESKYNTVQASRVIDVTQYPDMQELLAITDAGITDYSSWIYDYVLMRKPGFIFAMDIDDYNNERGFYFKLEQTPFGVSTDTDELVDRIHEFDETSYQQKIDEFLADKGCMDDGDAAIRIADQCLEWMK